MLGLNRLEHDPDHSPLSSAGVNVHMSFLQYPLCFSVRVDLFIAQIITNT
jgi:hypothetical protein